MPPIPRRLSSVGYSGPYPTVTIKREQFYKLQETYGVQLSTRDRRAIRKIVKDFLIWRTRELVSHSRSETRRLFEKVKASVEPFTKFATGTLLDMGDVAGELEGLLAEQYRRSIIPLHPSHLRLQMENGALVVPEVDQPLLLSLNATVLMCVGEGLSQAMRRVDHWFDQDDKSGFRGFAPGLAFDDLLWRLRRWAMRSGYPISPYSIPGYKEVAGGTPDKVAAPFSKFIFELNLFIGCAQIPEGLCTADGTPIGSIQEKIVTPEAVAERLKAVARRANAKAAQGS
jgi:hypothetical protein